MSRVQRSWSLFSYRLKYPRERGRNNPAGKVFYPGVGDYVIVIQDDIARAGCLGKEVGSYNVSSVASDFGGGNVFRYRRNRRRRNIREGLPGAGYGEGSLMSAESV